MILEEWNFREIIKIQTLKLLDCRKQYWKKRCTNRWMLLGEENTIFFESIATERYRMNTISHISDSDEQTITLHEDKADLFFKSFKARLRT